MTQGASPSASSADDFSDVFERDSHDRGADPVAPDAGQPRDDAGRFAAKSEAPPEPAPQPQQPQQELASQPQQDPDANRHVPLRELKSERTKRQEAEAREREWKAKADAYEQLVGRFQQPQPQQQQEQPQPIDPYVDPVGYRQQVIQEARFQQRQDIANMSEAAAKRTYGDALVKEAERWVEKTGQAPNFFWRSADPYDDLVQSYKRYQALQEIGPNPAGYREKLTNEIRAQVLAELKAGGSQPPQKFPGSLASATGAGAQGAHLSMEAVAAEMFDSNRNRRSW